ncbi:hypothetical protein CP532_6145 [Ophiocordyceps camponoti-leonardi (nom. inval.)]|nr:hypothetical protein CP532_6145 [Ophiocordyceps camponoti-leonardi (nom. inval.)]
MEAASSRIWTRPKLAVAKNLARRSFSALERPPANYPGHVPLTVTERVGMAIGSGVMALFNPYRHDLIAALGETTATPYFIYRLRDTMLSCPTGRRMLRLRPRITSASLSLPTLRAMHPESVGRAYVSWLDREGVSPDTRAPVRYIDDEECAYVMQRYRESHDFYHAITGLPVFREGELALKAFEFANTGLPMTGLSLLAYTTLKPKQRARFRSIYLPWAVRSGARAKPLINVFWEEVMERRVDDLRAELAVEKPPDLREIRLKERQQRQAAQAVASGDGAG